MVVCSLALLACQQEEIGKLPEEGNIVAEQTKGEVRKGVLQVKFTTELNARTQMQTRADGIALTGEPAIDSALLSLGNVRMERIFPHAGKFEEKHKAAGLDRWYRLVFDENIDPVALQEIYARLQGVEKVSPEYNICISEKEKITPDYVSRLIALPGTKASQEMPFNDPKLNMQWHYDQGNLTVTSGAGIGLFKAWRVTTGDPRVVVAVLDMGVDYTHPDLAANMWVNEAELNGVPGVDDDGNGKIDDIYGYDFEQGKGEITPGDHGTHVAGTIAAVNNNGIGVCGVAGGSGTGDGVRIMGCSLGSMRVTLMNPEDAIVYAADNGASIIQCSWVVPHTEALYEAIDYFVNNAGNELMKGGLAVFAAGNDGVTARQYPAAYDNTLAVASLNQSNRRSSFSNYGNWIDISAPGGAGATGGSEAYGILSTIPGGDYGYMSGTSMAAPHVSGVAGLIISAKGGPGFTAEKLKEILLTSVGPLNPDEAHVSLMGKGALRADNALWDNDHTAPEAVTDLKIDRLYGKGILTWHIAKDINDGQPLEYVIYYNTTSPANGNGAQKAVISVRGFKAGDKFVCEWPVFPSNATWHVAVAGRDTWENESALSNEVTIDWQNDAKAPAVVTDIRFAEEGGRLFLAWVNPVDEKDGTAAFYRLTVYHEEGNAGTLVLDTLIEAVGRAGDLTKIPLEISGLDENYVFRLAAVDCWNNSSEFSEGVVYFPVAPDELKTYPNPVQKVLHLKWGAHFSGTKAVSLYDMSGRRVFRQELGAGSGAGQTEVDFSAVAAGAYLLRFEADGKTVTRNIMKVK